MTDRPTRRALLSVSDKAGLVEFARALAGLGIELVSTGGTARLLRDAGLDRDRRRHAHRRARDPGWPGQDPPSGDPRRHPRAPRRSRPTWRPSTPSTSRRSTSWRSTSTRSRRPIAAGAGDDEAIEMIDVGGPALIRAAAKNHASVTVVSDPADYAPVIAELKAQRRRHQRGAAPRARRQGVRAHRRLRRRDRPLVRRPPGRGPARAPDPQRDAGARSCATARTRISAPRSTSPRARGGASPRPRRSRARRLSYNNLADADAAFELVSEFGAPAVAIVKHANPCGVAVDPDLARAYARALACDPRAPTAASSPSIARSTRRRPRRSRPCSPRW